MSFKVRITIYLRCFPCSHATRVCSVFIALNMSMEIIVLIATIKSFVTVNEKKPRS